MMQPSPKCENVIFQGRRVRLRSARGLVSLVASLVVPYIVAKLFFAPLVELSEANTNIPTKTKTEAEIHRAKVSETFPRQIQYGASYYEAFVHPAMVTNGRSQQRVAIVGDAEGFLLREVLKHATVTTCAVFDKDRELSKQTRTHLLESVDYSDFVLDANSSDNLTIQSCFDDPRTELHSGDSISWFVDRYGEGKEVEDDDKFDVIILDYLNPSTLEDERFVASLVSALEEDQGVVVMQVGEAGHQSDLLLHLATLERLLKAYGMSAMKSYSETQGLFSGPCEFRIVFMEGSLPNFYRDAALVEWDLAQRAIPTKSGRSPFHYFDGATMALYQYPSRTEENFFCQNRDGDSVFCAGHRGFDPYRPLLPGSALEVKESTVPNAGRGVFFKEDVRAGAYFTLEQNVHSMNVMPKTMRIANATLNFLESKGIDDQFEVLISYIHGYGYDCEYYGDVGAFVDAGVGTFVNHGCNESYVIGARTSANEITADPYDLPDFMVLDHPMERAFYNPFMDRNHFVSNTEENLLVDVKAGDEVLSNYLDYLSLEDWTEQIIELKAECLEQRGGSIFQYDAKRSNRAMQACPSCSVSGNDTSLSLVRGGDEITYRST